METAEQDNEFGRGWKVGLKLAESTMKLASQRSLRLDLTPAEPASAVAAYSGASRTQAPSRPRRLHKIQADAFQGSPMGVGREKS